MRVSLPVLPSPLLPSLAFGACLALAGTQVSPAAPAKAAPKSAAPTAALVARGKSLAASDGCNSCHAANYGGKRGFSPSLHAGGVTRQYNAKTFARVMDTGVTEDGGHVQKPMPVYHLPAKDGTALYAFFKTLK